MSFVILGIGTALPPHSIDQTAAAEYALPVACRTEQQRRLLPKLYRLSGVERRSSVILERPEGDGNRQSFFPMPTGEDDMGPTIRPRMEWYEREAGPLACRAGAKALETSGCAGSDITHLITVSCSGFYAPGADVALINGLGLSPSVERTHVGFMGCHGAFNGLRVAKAFAGMDRAARTMVCAVELCSLHYQYGWDPEQTVANALFADGAAAVVGGGVDDSLNGAWQLAGTGSYLIPESEDAMRWRIGDNGFAMTLSPRVPELISSHLKGWMEEWLAGHDLALGDVQSWAIHPGGPRILKAAGRALGLDRAAMGVSHDILRERGNMSSPTILFILERMRKADAPRPCVALGFGPGLVAEAMLFL